MNYKVVIDAGHGGVDSGNTIGNNEEKNITLQISNYIYNRLKELKIPVALTREGDETLDRDERVNRALSFFGDGENVIIISNHVNTANTEGAEVIYALRNTDDLAKLISSSLNQTGINVEKYYQRRLPEDTSKDYYYIHRLTGNTQPILINYGSSDIDQNIEKYGEAVVKAIVQYIGENYDKTEENGTIYVVKKGDSLYQIARRYGVSVDELKNVNDLTTNNLSIGQYLIIPTAQNSNQDEGETTIVYTVQSGDNLYQIARRYNVSVDDIVTLNQLPNNSLSINQQLLIPISSNTNSNNNQDISNDILYAVQSGDSLWKIAHQYNVSVNEIKQANNLTSNLLNIGDTLIIPSTNITYVVQSGDSLYSIAKKFNTTVDKIKKQNNLTSNLLSIGQVLVIPS